jgi:hypothetical protein
LVLGQVLHCCLPAAALQLLLEDLQKEWLVQRCVDDRALQEEGMKLWSVIWLACCAA